MAEGTVLRPLRMSTTRCAASAVAALLAVGLAPSVGHAATATTVAPANVWAWGSNAQGQFGDGGTTSASTPVAGTVPAGVSYTSIAAGSSHGAALDTTGHVWTWGSDHCGQLGDNPPGFNTRYTSSAVEVPLPAGVRVTTISAKGDFTMALDSAGHGWGWGTNAFGELGSGQAGGASMSTGDCYPYPPVAVTMPAGVTFTAISAGETHTLALDTSGNAWAWGWNGYGQLGNPQTSYASDVPVPVTMPSGVTFSAISAGYQFSLALDTTGRAWSWGANFHGELGNGGTADGAVPAPVAGPSGNSPGGITFAALSAGYSGSVGLDTAGKAWAWGYNHDGELGNGTTTDSTVPTAVSMPSGVTFNSIIAGFSAHSVALDSAGRAWAWGDNQDGELGSGSSAPYSATPVAVSMPARATFSAVAAGAGFSLALRPAATPPSRYTAVAPTRLCDTRPVQPGVAANQCNNDQPRSAAPIAPSGTLVIDVCKGAGASCSLNAVVLNVTVTGPTTASYLTAYPTGESPPTASNLNYLPGQTVANLVAVKVGANGTITLYNHSGTADVVVDLEGTLSTASSGPGLFTAVAPQRVCDTRPDQQGVSTNQCNSNGAGATLGRNGSLTVQLTGQGGIPASGVSAVALNLTATDTSSSGYLTAWPAGDPQPTASNVNWTPGHSVPNRVIVPVNKQGQVSIYNAQGLADVVIDVDGWYGDGTETGPAGAMTSAVTPTRICDTRALQPGVVVNQCNSNGAGDRLGAAQQRNIAVTGGVVPSGAHAVLLNVTVTGTSSPGYLTVWPGDAPTGASDLNWAAGQTVANLVLVKLNAAGQVSVYSNSGGVDVVIDVLGFSP